MKTFTRDVSRSNPLNLKNDPDYDADPHPGPDQIHNHCGGCLRYLTDSLVVYWDYYKKSTFFYLRHRRLCF